MKYTEVSGGYVLKLEIGDEIIDSIVSFCKEKGIKSGVLSGIGAAEDLAILFFDREKKEYIPREFMGQSYEIVSMNGNISLLDGEPMAHAHIALGDADYNVFGGHLKSGIVSVTCEIALTMTDGHIERAYDEETRLNLLDLSNRNG